MVKSEVSESLQVTNYQFDLYILAYSKVYTKNIFYLYFYYCAITIDAIKSGRFFALSCGVVKAVVVVLAAAVTPRSQSQVA